MPLIVVLFFVSGATALMGEVVWMRMLGLTLGNTVWAAAAAVAVWMGGMALGAHLGGRLAPRTARHLRWYGIAEGVIGVFLVTSPQLHRLLLKAGAGLGPDLGGALVLGLAQRLALATVALAVPTVLMGLTLPLLVERLRGSKLAARVSLLYGINTIGATAGVFLVTYQLLPRLGERASLGVAGLACAAVAAVAILAEGRVPTGSPELSEPEGPAFRGRYLLLAALMGGAALAAELVWVRILVLHLGSRVYAFALLLGVYLLGIAAGSLLLRLVERAVSHPRILLARVQLVAGGALVAQLLALGFTGNLIAFLADSLGQLGSFAAAQSVLFLTVLVLFLPVTLLYGASFPLTVAAEPGRRSAGAHVGAVAAANTMGGIVGALAAPFLLVPWLGCQRTLLVLALVHLGVALALVRRLTMVVASVAVMVAMAGVLWGLPRDWVLRRAGVREPGIEVETLDLRESLSATVQVKRYRQAAGVWTSLELNGVNVAGTEPALRAVQQLQGHLPLLQVRDPRSVLHVGFGSGGTCWAVSRHPVERIRVVEISPEVVAAADTYFPSVNHYVLADGRVRVIINDGRNYLLASEETYDVILSDSIHPVYAGNGTLYTLEYFRLCREHLNPGGVVSMWLPLYSLDQESYLRILAAFHQVFPRTAVWYDVSTVNEYTVVTGQVEGGPIAIDWDRLSDPGLVSSLAEGGVREPTDLAADLLLGPREVAALVAEVPGHEDDLPFVEYTAGRIIARERTWHDNLLMLTAYRARASSFADPTVPWTEARAWRDERLRWILGRIQEIIGGPAAPMTEPVSAPGLQASQGGLIGE